MGERWQTVVNVRAGEVAPEAVVPDVVHPVHRLGSRGAQPDRAAVVIGSTNRPSRCRSPASNSRAAVGHRGTMLRGANHDRRCRRNNAAARNPQIPVGPLVGAVAGGGVRGSAGYC